MKEADFYIKTRFTKEEYNVLLDALRFYGFSCLNFSYYEACEDCNDVIHKIIDNAVMIQRG